jgi:serine/threonine protein kinase
MLRRRMVKNPTAVERFLSEVRAVNQIRHENIIEVTDLFETEDGHLCTIMEVLEGRSLAGLLKSVKIVRPERAVRVGYQVASAMVAVHDAHIVHRDIKPENIFLTQKAGRDDFVKLLDFGVAKLIDPHDGKSLHDTGVGATVGTRDYMSPEQLVGTGVDHRADIFSLGVVLYEVLTGERPFKSDTDRGMLFAQLEKPQPPRAVKPAVPEELSALVMQCLENDANKRPQTMREVKGRLEAIAEGFGRGDGEVSQKEPAFPKGGIDLFAMETDTSPERAALKSVEESLPEVDSADVADVPVEATMPQASMPVAPLSTPKTVSTTLPNMTAPTPAPIVMRKGIHPAAVVALMAATAAVTLALAWFRLH